MTIWLDAHLSPRIAQWLAETFSVSARTVRDFGLRDAEDEEIFLAAKKAADVVITKDSDFVELLERHGSPPKIIWLTCGNTSDAALREIFSGHFQEAMRLLDSGEDLVDYRHARYLQRLRYEERPDGQSMRKSRNRVLLRFPKVARGSQTGARGWNRVVILETLNLKLTQKRARWAQGWH